MVVEMGAQSEDAAKFNRASALYFHLFGYEVLNSVVMLREGELHVLVRGEKGAELDRLLGRTNPNAKEGEPSLVLKVHPWDTAASVRPLISAAASAGPTLGVLRSSGSALPGIGSSSSDYACEASGKGGGGLLRAWDTAIRKEGFILVDVSRAIGAVLAKKDDDAIVRTAAAGRVACRALCDGVTRLVEAAFDADRDERATHDALAQQIDALMCDALAPHCARTVPKMKDVSEAVAKRCSTAASVACASASATRSTRLVESCYFPIVTSGGACTTDAGAASDADAINDDVVVVEFGARFASYCTNVARTFFVEPLPSLEKCYAALRGVHAACVASMLDGTPLSSVATAAHEWLEQHDCAHLAKFLPRHNFGFALGLDFRDDELVLTRNNSRHFEARMIFNVAIGLHGVPLDAAERRKARGAIRDLKKVSMLLADTVLVQSGGAPPVVLTDFSLTRPALKDWREVSNLATSQRERAAALAAQRAAAAEAELLAQLDAEDAASKPKNSAPTAAKKASKSKKKKPLSSASPTRQLTDGNRAAPAPAPPPAKSGLDDTLASPDKAVRDESPDDAAAVSKVRPPSALVVHEETAVSEEDADDESGSSETEAEAAQLLERVRAAGRSRWCESCETAIKDAREFLDEQQQQPGPERSVVMAALDRATRDLAEALPAWRSIELALERSRSGDQVRSALNKASAAGFPAKATAVKRARRRLKELESQPAVESAAPTAVAAVTTKSAMTTATPQSISSTLRSKVDESFVMVAAKTAPREPKPTTAKVVDELSKYFHGDEHEILQLREQKIDLTQLVVLAGRGAPRLAPWRDSQPPPHAVAVGRVLGLLGRLAPRVFVNLNAAERAGLLVRGGSPPREWLALANPPVDLSRADEPLPAASTPPPIVSPTPVFSPAPAPAASLLEPPVKPPRAWGAPAKPPPGVVKPPAHVKSSSSLAAPPGVLGPVDRAPLGASSSTDLPRAAADKPVRRALSSDVSLPMTEAAAEAPRRLRNPLVGASLDWQPSTTDARPTSSWGATPDSFGGMRDEISAMADAAYSAAVGGPVRAAAAAPYGPRQPTNRRPPPHLDHLDVRSLLRVSAASPVIGTSKAIGERRPATLAEVLRDRLPAYADPGTARALAAASRKWCRSVCTLCPTYFGTCRLCANPCAARCADCADRRDPDELIVCFTCLGRRPRVSSGLPRRLRPCSADMCGRLVCAKHSFKCDGVHCGCGRTFCHRCEPVDAGRACAGPLCGQCCTDCFFKRPDGPAHGYLGIDNHNRPIYKCAACRTPRRPPAAKLRGPSLAEPTILPPPGVPAPRGFFLRQPFFSPSAPRLVSDTSLLTDRFYPGSVSEHTPFGALSEPTAGLFSSGAVD